MTEQREEFHLRPAREAASPDGDSEPLVRESDYWNRRYAGEELIWTARANRFLVQEAEALAPGRALDLAAGEGRNAVWLAEQGWRVRAVDFSEIALEKGRQLAARRKVTDGIDFQLADLRDYEPGESCFDLVALVYLQLPQALLVPIIQRAARAVAPGGTFLLIAHDSANLERGHGGPQQPETLYTAEQVVAALGGDLEIQKAGVVERPVETGEGTKVALDCLVRRKRG